MNEEAVYRTAPATPGLLKILSLVFIDPGSNINFIPHELAGQLQLEGTLNKIFMKRVNEEYTKREVKVYRLGVEDA